MPRVFKRLLPLSLSLTVIVPTRNPGAYWPKWLKAFGQQRPNVSCLIVDSTSNDGTNFTSSTLVTQVLEIDAANFSHGGTRNFALQHIDPLTDVVVFMTQDALFADENALNNLVNVFLNPSVGCAFGRQLPHLDATPFARHARMFNYPSQSRIVSMSDKNELGIKTCFLSNSFAAYRVADLMAVGGFPADVILGEDMAVAAKMLTEGKSVAYVSESCVHHSHNYTTLEEFRRYFDTGVFHARQRWILQEFGSAGGEGLRFVLSELTYLWRNDPHLILSAVIRSFMKWLGYKLGRFEAHLPLVFKRWCSMHKPYWMKQDVIEKRVAY